MIGKHFFKLYSHIPTKTRPVKSPRENFNIVLMMAVTLTGKIGPETV